MNHPEARAPFLLAKEAVSRLQVAQVPVLIQRGGSHGLYPAQWLDPERACGSFIQKLGGTGVLKQKGLRGYIFPPLSP